LEPIIVDGVDGIRSLANQHLGKSDWITITQEMVNAFADVGQDHNWVHVDPETARNSPFKGTIAHGFLTMALLIPLKNKVMKLQNVGMGLNYGFNKVRMVAPVPTGSRIRLDLAVGNVEDSGDGVHYTLLCTVECDASEKPALFAEWLLRHYPSAQSRTK
jgi:acyl dehydratase